MCAHSRNSLRTSKADITATRNTISRRDAVVFFSTGREGTDCRRWPEEAPVSAAILSTLLEDVDDDCGTESVEESEVGTGSGEDWVLATGSGTELPPVSISGAEGFWACVCCWRLNWASTSCSDCVKKPQKHSIKFKYVTHSVIFAYKISRATLHCQKLTTTKNFFWCKKFLESPMTTIIKLAQIFFMY